MNGFKNLTQTFEAAERDHRELMEPYSILLAQASEDARERAEIMRQALRETFRRRYPMQDGFYDGKAVAA